MPLNLPDFDNFHITQPDKMEIIQNMMTFYNEFYERNQPYTIKRRKSDGNHTRIYQGKNKVAQFSHDNNQLASFLLSDEINCQIIDINILLQRLKKFYKHVKTHKRDAAIDYDIYRKLESDIEGDPILIGSYDGDVYIVGFHYSCPCGFVQIEKPSKAFINIMLERKDEKMTTLNTMNFEFGPANDNVRYSPYGMAITSDGENWFLYNPETEQVVDVTGLTFDLPNLIMKIPVAPDTIQPGNLILHKNKPMYVTEVYENSSLKVIDILESESKNIIPVTNMFNFSYVVKFVSMMNFNNGAPSPEQPFGANFGNILMMQMFFNNEKLKNDDMFKNIFLMQAFNGGTTNPFAAMFNFGNNT